MHHILQHGQVLSLLEILKGRGGLVRMAMVVVVMMKIMVMVMFGAGEVRLMQEWGRGRAVVRSGGKVCGCVRLQTVFDLMRVRH